MLEGELDIENEPRTQPQVQAQVQTREIDQVHLIIGLVCALNFLFTLDCNYRTLSYLAMNSILYMIFGVYIYRKKIDMVVYTVTFLITIAILYFSLSFVQYMSSTCVQTVCPAQIPCPTNTPTKSPTNGPTFQNSTG